MDKIFNNFQPGVEGILILKIKEVFGIVGAYDQGWNILGLNSAQLRLGLGFTSNKLSKPQPNFNSIYTKMTLHTHHHHHPPPKTQCQYYLICYWTDFDKTLNVGSWDHVGQIPSVKVTFVQATFVRVTFVHIKNNSNVIALIFFRQQIFWSKNYFGLKIFFGHKIFF